MSRIVIADDSSVARMVIIKSLEMLGVDSTKIIEVSNGQEALRVVKHNNVGLLITDLNMPIMDGKKLIRWIKSSPKLHNVPIVVITSAGNDAKRVELKNMGVEEVIHKPLNLRDLKQVICPKYVKDLFDQDQSKAAPCTYCGCHLCRQ